MIELSYWFEAAMLVCFGVSWPVSIFKTWRAGTVGGKSLIFLLLILVGYLAGIVAKCLAAHAQSKTIPWVTWLYGLNAIMVAVDVCLYLHLHRAVVK